MLTNSGIVGTKHLQAFDDEFPSTDRLQHDNFSDPKQASTIDTAIKNSSVEISTTDSFNDDTNAISDDFHNDNADWNADLLTYTPVHPSTHIEEESKSDDDEDRNRDEDDGGEDTFVRPRCPRNISRVQYSAAVLPKSITTCDEPTLSMALKSMERLHWVNVIRAEFATPVDLDTWEDAPELPQNASVIPSSFVFRLNRNEHGLLARLKGHLLAHCHLQEESLSTSQCIRP